MKADRRALILEAASRLFAQRGPSKTRVADVAREARVAVGSVYLEFPSKEALLGAIAASAHGRVLRAMKRELSAPNKSAVERLKSAMQARFDMFGQLVRLGHHGYAVFDSHCCQAIANAQVCHRGDEQKLLSSFFDAQPEFEGVDAAAFLHAYAAFAPPLLEARQLSSLQEQLPKLQEIVIRGITRQPAG